MSLERRSCDPGNTTRGSEPNMSYAPLSFCVFLEQASSHPCVTQDDLELLSLLCCCSLPRAKNGYEPPPRLVLCSTGDLTRGVCAC